MPYKSPGSHRVARAVATWRRAELRRHAGLLSARGVLLYCRDRPGTAALREELGEAHWVGSAMLVELRDRAAVEAMLAEAPYTRAGVYAGVEIHHWRFGRRPSAQATRVRAGTVPAPRFARLVKGCLSVSGGCLQHDEGELLLGRGA